MTEARDQKSEVSKTLALRPLLLALSLLSSLLLAPCFPAQAQQANKVPRIGYLGATDPAGESTRSEAIRLALRELGYVEGQSIAIESRYAEGKLDRLPDLAGELVRLKVDVMVVGGSTATRAAKNVTKLIPIVKIAGSRSFGTLRLAPCTMRFASPPRRSSRRWFLE